MKTSSFAVVILLLVGIVAGAVTPTRGAIVDFQRTVVVSPVGTAIENGVALLDAIAALAAATPDPSADDPYLLKIEPGVYDLGSASLTMLPHVDIEGSGRETTRIVGSGESVVNGADHTELRLLTVEHVGGTGMRIAIHTQGASMRITDVTAKVGTALIARAIFAQPPILIFNENELRLSRVTAQTPVDPAADGVGVSACCSAKMELVDVTASGRTGLLVINRTLTARNSVFSGSRQSLFIDLGTANIVATQLDGPVLVLTGAPRCVAAYDGALNTLGDNCRRPIFRLPF